MEIIPKENDSFKTTFQAREEMYLKRRMMQARARKWRVWGFLTISLFVAIHTPFIRNELNDMVYYYILMMCCVVMFSLFYSFYRHKPKRRKKSKPVISDPFEVQKKSLFGLEANTFNYCQIRDMKRKQFEDAIEFRDKMAHIQKMEMEDNDPYFFLRIESDFSKEEQKSRRRAPEPKNFRDFFSFRPAEKDRKLKLRNSNNFKKRKIPYMNPDERLDFDFKDARRVSEILMTSEYTKSGNFLNEVKRTYPNKVYTNSELKGLLKLSVLREKIKSEKELNEHINLLNDLNEGVTQNESNFSKHKKKLPYEIYNSKETMKKTRTPFEFVGNKNFTFDIKEDEPQQQNKRDSDFEHSKPFIPNVTPNYRVSTELPIVIDESEKRQKNFFEKILEGEYAKGKPHDDYAHEIVLEKYEITTFAMSIWIGNLRKWMQKRILRPTIDAITTLDVKLKRKSRSGFYEGFACRNKLSDDPPRNMIPRGMRAPSSEKLTLKSVLKYVIYQNEQMDPDLQMRMKVESYLETSFNCPREYLISRIIKLSKSVLKFKWDNGGTYRGRRWEKSLPNDSQIIMQLFCNYLNVILPKHKYYGYTRFTRNHFIDKTGDIDLKERGEELSKSGIYIMQESKNPPHFDIIFRGNLIKCQKGKMNVFYCIALFTFFIENKFDSYLCYGVKRISKNSKINLASILT